jgi:DTW domain-containing protein YfiP
VCARLQPITTRTRFVMLQHLLEQGKVSNTGRFATLCLSSLETRLYGRPASFDDLVAPGTWLLFPSDAPPPAGLPPPTRVVVLDASWSQARRMVQRVPQLRALPRLSLQVRTPMPSLREAPPGGVSTLQALARCVEQLEGPEAAAPLDALHQVLVDRVLAARGYL